jgi:26S proteasome regulatory subunit N5
MDRQEKVELILEQMRYCIATKDFIRTQIISKKISVRFFDKDEHQVHSSFYLVMFLV